MPNHVDNELYITGPKAEVRKFLDHVRVGDKAFDADKIIPYPQHFKDLDLAAKDHNEAVMSGRIIGKLKPDGFNSGGYEWCVRNWGTKWGMYNFSRVRETVRGASMRFDTAWSPPILIIDAAARMFPELTFKLKYFERGAGFQGIYEVKGSQWTKDYRDKYSGSRGG